MGKNRMSNSNPSTPQRKITVSNELVVEKHEEAIRIVQGNPGQFKPDSVTIPDSETRTLLDTMEELTDADV